MHSLWLERVEVAQYKCCLCVVKRQREKVKVAPHVSTQTREFKLLTTVAFKSLNQLLAGKS